MGLVLCKVIKAHDSVSGAMDDERRGRQCILSSPCLLTWLTHRKEMGSEGFWLINQSINHLAIAKFKLVMWFLIF